MGIENSRSDSFPLNASQRVELHALRDRLNAEIAQGRGNDLSPDYLGLNRDLGIDDPLAAVYGEEHVGVSVFDIPSSGLSSNNRLGLVVDPDLEGEASGVGLRVKANLVGLGLLAHDEIEDMSGDLTDEQVDAEVADDEESAEHEDSTPAEIVDEISMSGARVIEPIKRRRSFKDMD